MQEELIYSDFDKLLERFRDKIVIECIARSAHEAELVLNTYFFILPEHETIFILLQTMLQFILAVQFGFVL